MSNAECGMTSWEYGTKQDSGGPMQDRSSTLSIFIPQSAIRIPHSRNPQSAIGNPHSTGGPGKKVIMRDYHRHRFENRVAMKTSAKLGVCEICRYILVAGAMAALVISYSWIRSEIISLGYQIQEIKHDTAVLKEQRQALMLEQAACKSPQRIDQYAREQ